MKNLTPRQIDVLNHPCTDAREWGDPRYRQVVIRGAVEVVTFLAFDWFADSLPCWHVAVAIKAGPSHLKPVSAWGHNDEGAAMAAALETLGTAGEGKRGRWARKTEDGLDLYRAPTELEKEWVAKILLSKPALPPEFELPAELKNERIDGVRDTEIGRNGTATSASRVQLFRVQSE